MLDALIKKLSLQKKIRHTKVGATQIEALLKEAILDLKEANAIARIARRATFLLAYNAMLKTGRALMLLHGWVPDDGGQHKTVVEMTGVLLGDEYKGLVTHFEFMRRKRNDLTYEAGIQMTKNESR